MSLGLPFLVFGILLGASLYLAVRNRVRSASRFYTAEGAIGPRRNGIATAGDYLSAASFVGTIAAFSSNAEEALVYTVGAVAGWPVLACLIVEPLRKVGRYTFADVLCRNLRERPIRIMTGTSTLIICCGYLVAQLVAAGTIAKLMFQLPYVEAVSAVGALMVVSVLIGGMVATTWIQVVKALVLLIVAFSLAGLLLMRYPGELASYVASAHQWAETASRLTQHRLLDSPFSAISLALAFAFGPAGMPHVLMRTLTVRNSYDARRSLVYATTLIALFQLAVMILGYGVLIVPPGDAPGEVHPGPNSAVFSLAGLLGGNLLMLVVAATAFATILAVVAGLTLAAATAVTHDLIKGSFGSDRISESQELALSRLATATIGVIAVLLAIVFQNQNVAFLATLPLVAAASAHFPILMLAIYWPRLTTAGALAGGYVGLGLSITLVALSPKVWVGTLGHSEALFPMDYPTAITMAAAIAAAYSVSQWDRLSAINGSKPSAEKL